MSSSTVDGHGKKAVASNECDINVESDSRLFRERSPHELPEQVVDSRLETRERSVPREALSQATPRLFAGRDDHHLSFLGQQEPHDLHAMREIPLSFLKEGLLVLVLSGDFGSQEGGPAETRAGCRLSSRDRERWPPPPGSSWPMRRPASFPPTRNSGCSRLHSPRTRFKSLATMACSSPRGGM
jgi:hypothetical protein